MSRNLLFIFMLCASVSKAQTAKNPFKRFGFQAGVDISNMDFNRGSTATSATVDASWKTGFTFGFILSIPLAKNLTLQPEYSFTQRNGADKSLGIDYSIDYLTLPVLINYHISPRFALLAGPQIELTVDASSTFEGVSTTITHVVEERSIGITGGFEYDFINSFFLSARYFHGLNNIGIYQRTDVKEYKYEVVNITAGIRF